MNKIKLEYRHTKQVAEITLNAPKANILDQEMMEEISIVLKKLNGQKGLKLIVLQAEGKHFSFGASVAEHRKENAPQMLKSFHQLLIQLSELHLPVLSKVKGLCLGGAFELVLATHVVFAESTAQFGQPEVNLSVFPPPASLLLPLKIGFARAEELLLTGRNIKAEEARSFGLVNQLFDSEQELNSGAEAWIEKHILDKSATALRFAMKAGRLRLNQLMKEYLPQLEKLYLEELMETYDANEGIASFLENRQPVWQNN